MILGDGTCCLIKTEDVFKGKPGEPIVEGTTFGWVIHGGGHVTDVCLFTREISDYEWLCSLHILGIEDWGESSHLDMLREFVENISRKADGRYKANIPWNGSQNGVRYKLISPVILWLDLPLIATKGFSLPTISNYSSGQHTKSPKGSVHANISKFNPIQNCNTVYGGRGGGNNYFTTL